MKLFDKVSLILSELSGIETICSEHELKSDLGLDSLSRILILVALEERMNITIEGSDLDPKELRTVGGFVRLAEKYGVGKNA